MRLFLQHHCIYKSSVVFRQFLVYLFLMVGQLVAAQVVCDIRGRISSGGADLPGAQIEVYELGLKTTTDSKGAFVLENVPCQSLLILIWAEDHQTQTIQLDVQPQLPEQAWDLQRVINILPDVEVRTNGLEGSPLVKTLPVQTADRDYLESQSTANFASGLEKKAGINTIQTGIGIGKPMIRGLAFNRIQVNTNGIKQEGQQWGADHGLELDAFDVTGVEIVKGPASLIYGSDAMGGAINIVPEPAYRTDTLNVRYTGIHHTNNQLWGHSLQIGGRKDAWWLAIRGSTMQFSDYRVNADRFTYAGFVLPIYEQRLKNTAGCELNGSIRLGWVHEKIQSTLTITTFNQKAGLFVGAVGIPNSYNLQHRGDFRNTELPRQENTHHKIVWNNVLPLKNGHLEIDLGYQLNLRNEYAFPHAHGYPVSFSDTLSLGLHLQTLTGNARWHKNLANGWRQILGLQLQHMQNKFDGFEFLIPRFTTTQTGAFGFWEKSLRKNWVITTGLRGDWAQHNITAHKQPVFSNGRFTGSEELRNPDITRDFGNISGAVGAKWEQRPNSVWKFNLGSSFRIPTAIELSMNGVHHGNFRHEKGAADLNSERGYQLDINYEWRHKFGSITSSAFGSLYDQYIYLAPQPRFSALAGAGALWQYQQNDAVFGGFELEIQQQLTSWLCIQSTNDYVRNQNLNTGLPLPLTPPFVTRNRLVFQQPKAIKKVQAEFFVEWMAAASQNRTDRNERATPGYQLWEAGVMVQYGTHLKLHITAQNLADRPYFNHLSRYRLLNLPEPGRNITIRLIANLGA